MKVQQPTVRGLVTLLTHEVVTLMQLAHALGTKKTSNHSAELGRVPGNSRTPTARLSFSADVANVGKHNIRVNAAQQLEMSNVASAGKQDTTLLSVNRQLVHRYLRKHSTGRSILRCY